MKRFTIGDIHGNFKALKQCLEKSNFNYKEDKLIVLGDICDGFSCTYQVVEELLKIDNLIFIIGNHDEWFMNHMRSGWSHDIWLHQGGINTIKSYTKGELGYNIPVTHQAFFNEGKYYHIEDNMIFIHGGFITDERLIDQKPSTFTWDRSIIEYAKKQPIPFNDVVKEEISEDILWNKVFIGHSDTRYINKKIIPLKYNNLWCLDTGCGWLGGKLTIMDIDTEEYWQSDEVGPHER